MSGGGGVRKGLRLCFAVGHTYYSSIHTGQIFCDKDQARTGVYVFDLTAQAFAVNLVVTGILMMAYLPIILVRAWALQLHNDAHVT